MTEKEIVVGQPINITSGYFTEETANSVWRNFLSASPWKVTGKTQAEKNRKYIVTITNEKPLPTPLKSITRDKLELVTEIDFTSEKTIIYLREIVRDPRYPELVGGTDLLGRFRLQGYCKGYSYTFPDLIKDLPIDLTATMKYSILWEKNSQSLQQQWLLPDLKVDEFPIALSDISLYRIMSPDPADNDNTTFWALDSICQIASEKFGVRGNLEHHNISLTLSGLEGKGLPGPASLLKILGQEDTCKTLQAAIDQVPILKTLAVDSVRIGFNSKPIKLASIDIFGHFKIDQYIFTYRFSYPQNNFMIGLSDHTPLPLGVFISNITKEKIPVDLDLKISELDLVVGSKPFSIASTVALKDIWKIPFLKSQISVDQLSLSIEKNGGEKIGFTGFGRITFAGVDVTGTIIYPADKAKGGFIIQTSIGKAEPIKVDQLIKSLSVYLDLPQPSDLPEISIGNIQLEVNTHTGEFGFSATAKWAKTIGPVPAGQAAFVLNRKRKGDELHTTFGLTGQCEIAKSMMDFEIELGKPDWHVSISWKKDKSEGFALTSLIQAIDKNFNESTIPKEIRDLTTLSALGLKYQNKSIQLKAETTGGLGIALYLASTGNNTGGCLAIQYKDPKEMPVLGKHLSNVPNTVRLNSANLIFSWFPEGREIPSSVLPQLPSVDFSKIKKGIAFAAELSLDDHEGLKEFGKSSGLKSLTVFGALTDEQGSAKLRIQAGWAGGLKIETGNYPLSLRDCHFGIEVSPTLLNIYANGKVDFKIDQQAAHANVGLDIGTTGIQMRGGVVFPEKGTALFGLNSVRLYNFYVLIGVRFTPPSVVIGAMGEMSFLPEATVHEKAALVLEFSSPVPVPSYFALHISKIDLADVIRALSDQKNASRVPKDLLGVQGLSFYYSSKSQTLPNGNQVSIGTGFQGLFNVGEWKAYVEFKISGPEYSGFGALAPIDLPGFVIRGNGEAYSMKGVSSAGQWIPISNANPPEKGTPIETREVIPRGGAFVRMNSKGDPLFAADFNVKLLDIVQAKSNIGITNEGMTFSLAANVPAVYRTNLTVVADRQHGVHTTGDFFAGFEPELLGPLKNVKIGIKGHQDIKIGPKSFHIIYKVSYDIFGIEFRGPELNIPHEPKDFGEVILMAINNFWTNVINTNIIVQLVEKVFWNNVKGLRSDRWYREADSPEILTWDKSLLKLKGDVPENRILKASSDTSLQETMREISNSSQAEVNRMNEVEMYISEIHNDKVRQLIQKVHDDITKNERIVRGLIEHKDVIFNQLLKIRMTFFEEIIELEMQSQRTLQGSEQRRNIQNELNEIEEKIRSKNLTFASEFNPHVGYSGSENKFSPEAIEIINKRVILKVTTEVRTSILISDAREHARQILRDEFLTNPHFRNEKRRFDTIPE